MVSGDAALRFEWTKAQLLEKIETGAWREETLDEQTDICYTEGREIKVENQSNEKNPLRVSRKEQDGKPELPVISALFKFVPSRFTPHLHQTQPHGALTKAPGRAGTAGQTWGFLVVYVKLTCGACNLHDFS